MSRLRLSSIFASGRAPLGRGLGVLLGLAVGTAVAEEPKPLFDWSKDGWWLGAGLAFQASGQWASSSLPVKKPGVEGAGLPWDKPFRGQRNETARTWSDIALVVAVPVVMDAGLSGSGWNRALQEAGVYSQVLLVNSGLNLWVRSLSVWPRPEYHSEGFDLEAAPNSVMGSFYSGHASSAFALATSWYLLRKDRGDDPYWPYAGFVAAAGISALRVAAGKHYPSDVLVGAAVGVGLGALITNSYIDRERKSGEQSVAFVPPIAIAVYF